MSSNHRNQLPDWITLSSPLPSRRSNLSNDGPQEREVANHAYAYTDSFEARLPRPSDYYRMSPREDNRGSSHTETGVFQEISMAYRPISNSGLDYQQLKREKRNHLQMDTGNKSIQECLRELLMDPATEPDTIRSFLETKSHDDESYMRQLLQARDRFGQTALDHTIMMVVKTFFRLQHMWCKGNNESSSLWPDQAKRSFKTEISTDLALGRMSVVMKFQQGSNETHEIVSDKPLIRLLSLASSGERTGQAVASKEYIHRAVEIVLSLWPCALYQSANISGCSCLHIALRHYGDDLELIRYLLEQDSEHRLVQKRNFAGDLALHVASSQQVCWDVLKLVVERTVEASPHLPNAVSSGVGLAGSSNHTGWTPLDLELIKYLEGGECKHTRSISRRFTVVPENDRILSLSRQAQNIMQRNDFRQADISSPQRVSGEAFELSNWQNRRTPVYEMVWQRSIEYIKDIPQHSPMSHFESNFISRAILLINASTIGNSETLEPCFDLASTKNIVHRASILCARCKSASSARGSSISFFLLDYLAWKFPEQISQRDNQHGRLPLHYAVVLFGGGNRHNGGEASLTSSSQRRQVESLLVWSDWIKQLLTHFPKATMVRDDNGRLPLHCFIDCLTQDDFVTTIHSERVERNCIDFIDSNTRHLSCAAECDAIQKVTSLLVNTYPESLQYLDPVSNLFPFSQMAVHGHVETTYSLLRACPCVLANWRESRQSQFSSPSLDV